MQPVITPNPDQETSVDVSIHEPALTEDNLGLKTWASSYVLARKWHELREQLPIPRRQGHNDSSKITVLELGAGTGLVGIAAAAVLGTNVLLTDLPEIVPNLARNAADNAQTIAARGGSTAVAILDWMRPEEVQYVAHSTNASSTEESTDVGQRAAEKTCLSVPIIVAADPIYSIDHPRWLAQAVQYHLLREKDARVIVEIPIRDAYSKERGLFVRCMKDIGLEIVSESRDIGYDDWSESRGEELAEVECWLTIWAWNERPM